MRVGLLADVHANLPALEAALAWLRSRGADTFVCAGDLVGYGPDPDACVERVGALGATVVAGNHDLIALGELTTERCVPLAKRTLAWTAETISDPTRAWLAALPRRATATGGLLVAHGSLDDPERYIRTPQDAAEQLARAAKLEPDAVGLILGHTHSALVVAQDAGPLLPGRDGVVRLPAGRRWLVNPGSVGQSRERRALVRAALLDLDARTVELARLPYDAKACRARLSERGLPPGACHMPPRPLRRVAGRTLRRLGLRS